ncbi:hypothetical protein V8F06_005634 [Rhypophila decipiens]
MSTLNLQKAKTQSGSSVPSLPEDIFDLIFAALCPPAPSQWIHGIEKDSLSAPAQPPDVTWSPNNNWRRHDWGATNELLVGNNVTGLPNFHYLEYKACMRTLAKVARTCAWARQLAERYLYRYVVLVSGGQLASFAAAVEGRLDLQMGGTDEESGAGLSRLGRYAWGCYCLVRMERWADLEQWYRFEMELEESKKKRLLETGLAGGLGKDEGAAGKKQKKKKPKQKKGNGKDKEKDQRKSREGSVVADEAVCGDDDRDRDRDSNNTAGAPTGSAKGKSASASRNRRNRRKKATEAMITPPDPMDEFFRLHSAVLQEDLHQGKDRRSLAPRNMYNLFLRLLLQPRLLPNLRDLLCSWYCIQRAVGIATEPDYLPAWIPGRIKLDANPSVLHKIKTFTIRPPVVHKYDYNCFSGRYYSWRDISCDLGTLIDAFPNLETFDTCYLQSSGYCDFLDRELLQETEDERRQRIYGKVIGTSPIKHVRIYWTFELPSKIAAFCRALRPGALETLLVRFHLLRDLMLMGHMSPPGVAILLGHEALIDSGSDSLRYLELLSTPARHYLNYTEEMMSKPRLRRLTCLPFLNKLEELVVDFQGLFGKITHLGHLQDEDTDLLQRGGCLPPNLIMLKVVCVWSGCTNPNVNPSSNSEGEYVVSDYDVATFIRAFRTAHQAGTLALGSSLRKLTLVVPEQLARLCGEHESEESRNLAADRRKEALKEAGLYFDGTQVEFVVETGRDVLNVPAGWDPDHQIERSQGAYRPPPAR